MQYLYLFPDWLMRFWICRVVVLRVGLYATAFGLDSLVAVKDACDFYDANG